MNCKFLFINFKMGNNQLKNITTKLQDKKWKYCSQIKDSPTGKVSELFYASSKANFKKYHKCWEYSVIFSSWKKMVESDSPRTTEMDIKEQLKSELKEYYKSKNYAEDENGMWNDEETGDLVYETMRKITELSREI